MILKTKITPSLNPRHVEDYDPHPVLDYLLKRYKVKNDAGIARLLQLHPAVISKIRHGTLVISADILIRLHEVTGLEIAELREMAGLPAYTVERVSEPA